MLRSARHLVCIVLIAVFTAQAQKQPTLPAQILSAKAVYFDDQTRAPAVGEKALARLKKWGGFQIVQDRAQADLIILLSADSYKGGNIVLADGQTATVEKNGNIAVDPVPNYNKVSPVRYAYLTVIDPKTGKSLWSDFHQWGGLLTGFNSAGERLVDKLEKEAKK